MQQSTVHALWRRYMPRLICIIERWPSGPRLCQTAAFPRERKTTPGNTVGDWFCAPVRARWRRKNRHFLANVDSRPIAKLRKFVVQLLILFTLCDTDYSVSERRVGPTLRRDRAWGTATCEIDQFRLDSTAACNLLRNDVERYVYMICVDTWTNMHTRTSHRFQVAERHHIIAYCLSASEWMAEWVRSLLATATDQYWTTDPRTPYKQRMIGLLVVYVSHTTAALCCCLTASLACSPCSLLLCVRPDIPKISEGIFRSSFYCRPVRSTAAVTVDDTELTWNAKSVMEYDRPKDADTTGTLAVDGDEHVRLVAEIPVIQRLPIGERLLLARRRRLDQVTRYERLQRHSAAGARHSRRTGTGHRGRRAVRFDGVVALQEAVRRNDVDEGSSTTLWFAKLWDFAGKKQVIEWAQKPAGLALPHSLQQHTTATSDCQR